MSDDDRASRLLPLTEQEFYVLLALAERHRHGYAVMQAVEEMTQERISIGPGTLYGAFKRMLRQGVIEPAERPEADPRRRAYRLTPLGRKVLGAERSRLERMTALLRARKVAPA